MKPTLLLCLSVPIALLLAATAFSYAKGSLPGTTGVPGTVPTTIVRTGQSCSQCHTDTVGAGIPDVTLSPDRHSLDASQSIQVTVAATGGVAGGAQPFGGFVTETTKGTLTAGSTTKTDAAGKFITHSFAFWGRSWQFGFTAPPTPGVFEMYTAANTANGDGTFDGDSWAFLGGTRQASAPQRLFVNAAGVTHRGLGCAGGTGVVPVLGSTRTPVVGSRTFDLELHGAPPSQPCVFVFGVTSTFQIDLGVVGVNGCTLYVQPLLEIPFGTTAGNPATADGTATFPSPIPANPALVGLQMDVQCVVVDVASGRRTPLTLSNAITFTVQ